MPGLMRQKPRGLFGSAASAVPSVMSPTSTQQPLAPKKPFDWAKAIGVLGDSLAIAGGAEPLYVPDLIAQRNRLQAQQYAEGKRQREFEDQKALIDYRRANPDPDYFDDNAGNRWSINPSTGERKLIFRDPNAKRIPQKTFGPNGEEYIEYIEIPNNVNEDGSFRTAPAAPTSPVGKLTPLGGKTPTGSGGMTPPPPANLMGQAEYQMFVRSMGKEGADRYLASQGITVGNY